MTLDGTGLRPRTWLFFAAIAYAASLIQVTVHEAFGHGLTAELLGGRFLSFYLSPLFGWADFRTTSDRAGLIVLGVAAPFTALLCLGLWALTYRSRRLFLRASGWYLGALGGIGNLAYWCTYPWLMSGSGGYEGDWAQVWGALGVPLVIPGVIGLVAVLGTSALSLLAARSILEPGDAPALAQGVSRPYWVMASAAWLPSLAYALILWPFWRASDRSLLAGVIIGPIVPWLGGLLVLLVVGRVFKNARSRTNVAGGEPLGQPSPRLTLSCLVTVLLLATGIAIAFGPATKLRRGIALRSLEPADYWEAGNEAELELVMQNDRTARLIVATRPPHDPDSPFQENRSREADRVGPSRGVCEDVLRDYVGRIDWLEFVSLESGPERSEGYWRFSAKARTSRSEIKFQVAYRPVTVVVKAPGIAVVGHSDRGVALTSTDGIARWERPTGMYGTDAFRFRWSATGAARSR